MAALQSNQERQQCRSCRFLALRYARAWMQLGLGTANEKRESVMIHRAASEGYAGVADVYARGRPGYPDEALSWLREVVGLSAGRTVIEIGAGTGKFLPMLLRSGAEVIALEPVDGMRSAIESRFDVRTLAGSAENISLPDESLDAVVCAQSFHWFATANSVAEMRRVLKPGGMLGLIWNGRDTTIPWVAAVNRIVDRYEGDAPRYQSGRWRDVFPAKGFTFADERHARLLHTGSPEQVIIDRALSTSFIAALPVSQRTDVERDLRNLIDETPELHGTTEIAVPYDTLMVAYRRI